MCRTTLHFSLLYFHSFIMLIHIVIRIHIDTAQPTLKVFCSYENFFFFTLKVAVSLIYLPLMQCVSIVYLLKKLYKVLSYMELCTFI